MAGRLEGKVAVITGAANGIGRTTLELFVAEGARVVAADIADGPGAELERAHPGRVKYVHCEVLREEDIAATVATAEREFGRLDCYYSNAGTTGAPDPADGVTADGFDSVMRLHVRAALFGIKYAVPLMKQAGGGAIICSSSIAGLLTGFGPVLYSIAKAALIHMTRVTGARLAPFNIRVNCVCPGLVPTTIYAGAFGVETEFVDSRLEAMVEGAKASQPIPRGGRPGDVAEAVLYFASDASGWVTGQALPVDGGLTLGQTAAEQIAIAPIMAALGLDPENPAAGE